MNTLFSFSRYPHECLISCVLNRKDDAARIIYLLPAQQQQRHGECPLCYVAGCASVQACEWIVCVGMRDFITIARQLLDGR